MILQRRVGLLTKKHNRNELCHTYFNGISHCNCPITIKNMDQHPVLTIESGADNLRKHILNNEALNPLTHPTPPPLSFSLTYTLFLSPTLSLSPSFNRTDPKTILDLY